MAGGCSTGVGLIRAITSDAFPEPLTDEAKELWEQVRNPRGCNEICGDVHYPCMMGNGPVPANGMIVASSPSREDETFRSPFMESNDWTALLYLALGDVGVLPQQLYKTYAMKCNTGLRAQAAVPVLKECTPLLLQEIEAVQPHVILAIGGEAYWMFAHKQGITSNRGQAFEWTHPTALRDGKPLTAQVVPLLHPEYVMQNQRLSAAFISDIEKFERLLGGTWKQPSVRMVPIRTEYDLHTAFEYSELKDESRMLTFDLETRGLEDMDDSYARVWCAALTRGARDPDGAVRSWLLPLEHPQTTLVDGTLGPHRTEAIQESPVVREAVERFVRLVLNARAVNGHNVKFDVRNTWRLAERWGVTI